MRHDPAQSKQGRADRRAIGRNLMKQTPINGWIASSLRSSH